MNRLPLILLCAAAGLAGWGGMAWWRGAHVVSGKSATLAPAAGATAPGEFARPAGKLPAEGNPGISSIAAALTQAHAVDLDDDEALAKLDALPPGTARELAKALIDARRADRKGAESPPFNAFADLPADAPPAVLWGGALRDKLLSGKPLMLNAENGDEFPVSADPFEAPQEPVFGVDDITRWAALDPAAASETILKMPPGKTRTAAVDAAAKVMARDNPQAAWDMVLKSGEQKLGEGAARAWLAKILQNDDANQNLMARLSPTQQNRLAFSLRTLMEAAGGDSPQLNEQELSALTLGAPYLPAGPEQTKLLDAIAKEDPVRLIFLSGGEEFFLPDRFPVHTLAYARILEQTAQGDPLGVLSQLTKTDPGPDEYGSSPAVLNAAAPLVLPQLARAGHVKEAAQLLPRIPDPAARHAALESILPQWMDADPAAARAAFKAAPFTALERERWQRHPAFLLNPESPVK